MKIIHTADWHLCDSLGRIKRYDDFRSRVETIAGLCDEHAVDVVLIAGKGHEDYQIYGATRRSFSDRREARRYLGVAA